jgi:hypothetical protein
MGLLGLLGLLDLLGSLGLLGLLGWGRILQAARSHIGGGTSNGLPVAAGQEVMNPVCRPVGLLCVDPLARGIVGCVLRTRRIPPLSIILIGNHDFVAPPIVDSVDIA